MKKIILLLCTLLPFIAHAQSGFTITGVLSNLETPATAYLSYFQPGAKIIDSTVVKG